MEIDDQQDTAALIEEPQKAKEPEKKKSNRKAKAEDSGVPPKPSKCQKTVSIVSVKHFIPSITTNVTPY